MYPPKYFLPLVIGLILGCLYTGASYAAPAIWEAQIGSTVTDTVPLLPTSFLDDTDDADTGIEITFDDMSFQFVDGTVDGFTYTGNDAISISSNGLISLGGSNGSDPAGDIDVVRNYPNPSIAPLFTDLDPGNGGGDIYINRFDDDNDRITDRIVITYVTGMHDCTNEECYVLAQVQLLSDGTIIFGYNGVVQTANQTSPVFVGVSPGNGAADPGASDLGTDFDTGMEPTVYEDFTGAPPDFDLDDSNVVFVPNGTGGYTVSDTLASPPESTEPPNWESEFGHTLDGQALDNRDNATVNLTFGTMSFPFSGTTYTNMDILNISSNGFISLGGNNGNGCCNGNPLDLAGGLFARIAPLWTDLNPDIFGGGDIYINRFDDDNDPADIDRIVVTFATGHAQCAADECSVLAQVQLLDNGTIIFGYNGYDLENALDDVSSDLLIGISPGTTGVFPPFSTDISASATFTTATNGTTIFELFEANSEPPFDLDGKNVIFTPNTANNSFTVSVLGDNASIGTGGGGGGGGGCGLTGRGTPDPTLWLLALTAALCLKRRRRQQDSSCRP